MAQVAINPCFLPPAPVVPPSLSGFWVLLARLRDTGSKIAHSATFDGIIVLQEMGYFAVANVATNLTSIRLADCRQRAQRQWCEAEKRAEIVNPNKVLCELQLYFRRLHGWLSKRWSGEAKVMLPFTYAA